MGNIRVLDCTLRDGGYCNDCNFGLENEKKIISGLIEANIDIIECGFLTDRVEYDQNCTRFTSLAQMSNIIPQKRSEKLFVALKDCGKYDLNNIPEYDGTSIDGIRVAFHKKNIVEGLEECRIIKEKGYKVFVQPMVSVSYTDEEFLNLIKRVNELDPYAFYIVDSFGMMKRKDLMRLFYLVENNLKDGIYIGFHSHNNMQLAYSNAQALVESRTNRNLIIDSSVYGMGRGAGNLNSEIFVNYLNDTVDGHYELKPLLNIIDEILNEFYQRNYWGYSLSNYLSASHNAHPNYAGFLDDKKTLTVEDVNEIFDMMDEQKRIFFDKAYIEELYTRYMATGATMEKHKNELMEILRGQKVLLIAPGRSSGSEKNKIREFVDQTGAIPISVNFAYTEVDVKYIFLSNLRRYRDLDVVNRQKCIVTSKIPSDGVYLQTQYENLLNGVSMVEDNAGLMAIKFLMDYGVSELYLAGFDGYSHDVDDNYSDRHMIFNTRYSVLDAMNAGMSAVLTEYSKQMTIKFLTYPKYVNIQEKDK